VTSKVGWRPSLVWAGSIEAVCHNQTMRIRRPFCRADNNWSRRIEVWRSMVQKRAEMNHTFDDNEIIDGSNPGGATTSRSISVDSLAAVLAGCPRDAGFADYEGAAIERNLLGKQTYEGRRRAFRGLAELYGMDPKRILFRALRDLWFEDQSSQALLAGLCAFARDSTFRASGAAVLSAQPGDTVSTGQIASTLSQKFPLTYNEASLQKLARNTASSWLQAGHLVNSTAKKRVRVEATPAAMAYAMLLGHLQGLRGEALLASDWVRFLDMDLTTAQDMAEAASRSRYIEYKSGGGVIEVAFHHLLREEASR
jgi:hypothetical protein